MGKKLVYKIITTIVFLGLMGCSHVQPQSPSTTNATQSTTMSKPVVSSDPNDCERSLRLASYNLSFAKQQAKRAHVFADWSLANKALTAATNAHDEKNYDQCVQQAQLVNTYIERSQSYIKWKNSLNL